MENKSESCSCNVIHKEVVENVKNKLPKEETLYDLAELFKVFGDSTRIKIICSLFESEMCVCDLSVLLNFTLNIELILLLILRKRKILKHQ